MLVIPPLALTVPTSPRDPNSKCNVGNMHSFGGPNVGVVCMLGYLGLCEGGASSQAVRDRLVSFSGVESGVECC